MATVDRGYPGDLAAGLGFRTALNADREDAYGHLEGLEVSVETLADYFGNGTLPSNTAVCYINNPVAGRVYCEVGYMAIVGGVPVVTAAVIDQGYTAAALNHVYLVVDTSDGSLSLRVATGAVSEGANELWIADVTAVPAIDNTPVGKATALIVASKLAVALSALIQGTPTFTVGAEAANIINVAVQLKDSAGTNLAARHMVHAWLSDAIAGAPPAADDTPDGGVAIGANGTIIEAGHLQDYYWEIVSSATGAFDIDITHSAVHTYYLNVEYQGQVYTTDAIAFA